MTQTSVDLRGPSPLSGPEAGPVAGPATPSLEPEAAAGAPVRRDAAGSRRGRHVLAFLLRRPGLVLSVTLLALVVLAAFAPWVLAPGNPETGDTAVALQPPSAAHWFGTDHLGRDLFTRVVHGTSLSLRTALLAVALALVAGSLLGTLAGFVGGWVDTVVMRIVDVMLAIPSLLLSLAIIAALGFGSTNVAIAVAVGSVAGFARVARAQTLKVATSTYVEAARAVGTRWHTSLRRHVLPNASRPILALGLLEFGTAILAVSALSFLGFGAPRPAPEWGSLVTEGRDFIATAGWLTMLPGLTIAATVLAVHRVARVLGGEWRRSR